MPSTSTHAARTTPARVTLTYLFHPMRAPAAILSVQDASRRRRLGFHVGEPSLLREREGLHVGRHAPDAGIEARDQIGPDVGHPHSTRFRDCCAVTSKATLNCQNTVLRACVALMLTLERVAWCCAPLATEARADMNDLRVLWGGTRGLLTTSGAVHSQSYLSNLG